VSGDREREPWVMPGWMEPYRELIGNTGGNPIEELMNDRTTNARSNMIRSALIVSVESQVALLYRLRQGGHLLPPS
jgi:hypothetical protein